MTGAVLGEPSPPALVDEVRRTVDVLRRAAPGRNAGEWSHGEREAVIAGVDGLVRELTVYRGQVLLAHKNDGRWGTAHDRDFADWRARQTGAGRGPVLGELELAEGLDAMPEVADAVTRGELTIEHAKALSRVRSTGSAEVRQALDTGGVDELLETGKRLSAPELTRRARRWAAEVDAAAAQREFDAVRRRRTLTLRNHAGGVRGEFFLDPVAGAELRTALDAIAGRPAKDDHRTRPTRMADALSTMASRVLQVGADLNGAQVRPHLALLVSEETWAAVLEHRQAVDAQTDPGRTHGGGTGMTQVPVPDAPPAVLEDGTIVPLRELERILCDCEITRMVLDTSGVPLDVGQTRRTYTKELRRAVTTRDKTCQWPGCQIRASWCEVHHIRWFSQGGRTSLDNGISLCGFHHHRVHDQHVSVTALADGFDFHHHDGRHLGKTRRPGTPERKAARPGQRKQVPREGAANPGAAPPADAADVARDPTGSTASSFSERVPVAEAYMRSAPAEPRSSQDRSGTPRGSGRARPPTRR